MDSGTFETSSFMTLNRARGIFWVGTNYRPMGELYDNGFLTVSRLRWGMERAYDSNIRAASKVLLKQKEAELNSLVRKGAIPKTLDEARAVIWPFKTREIESGHSMGELIDSRELFKKDFGFAIDFARDECVRSAARILLSDMLRVENEKAQAPAGVLKVFSNRNYMAREREYISLRKGMFLGAFLVIALLILGVDVLWYMPKANWSVFFEVLASLFCHPLSAIITVLFLGIMAGLYFLLVTVLYKGLNKWVDRYDSRIENFRKGEEGEDRAVEAMREALDGSCCLFRNLVLPGGKQSDIDLVLVGACGVFVFEVKNWNGIFENEGTKWFAQRERKRKRRLLAKSPSVQGLGNAARLADFLAPDFNRNGDTKWVEPIVVMANPDVVFYEENPKVKIWRVEHLSEELGNLQCRCAISEKTQQDICGRLKKFYEDNSPLSH